MRRKRRNQQTRIEVTPEVAQEPLRFDDVLNRELDGPTIIELDADVAATTIACEPGGSDIGPATPTGSVDSTEAENALLRAELLAAQSASPNQPMSSVSAQSVTGATTAPAVATPQQVVETAQAPTPGNLPDVVPAVGWPPATEFEEVPSTPVRSVDGFQQYNFWDRHEEATASAELFAVPPAAITVVIGSLDVAVPVAERCQAGHWVSECDVYVLTEQEYVVGQPTWVTVRRPSDVVAVLEDGQSDFPLLVIDVPRELPAWVRPLVTRLRTGGVGLVHYVLGDSPSDEDLATWHGELGRPSVLDLASPVPPGRVLELLDRGEPLSSVAGMPISTELLLALRLNGA